MKRVIIILLGAILLVGCVQYEDGEPVEGESQEKQQEKATEKEQKETSKEEEVVSEAEKPKENNKIKIDEKLTFGEFTVNMEQVNVYEDEERTFADVTFKWLNQAGDGKKTFMQTSLLDVLQGDNVLEDTEGAWEVENNKTSSVYFPNAENGEIKITLTYELENTDDPLLIKFQPLNELIDEDGQEVTIDIK